MSQELIGDEKFFGGKPHWKALEELGEYIGLTVKEIRDEKPLMSTVSAWIMYDSLMSNSHWLLGLVGNTCVERAWIPGYGKKLLGGKGIAGFERDRWKSLFKLPDDQIVFFSMHSEADVKHSEMGWKNTAKYAVEYRLEDEVLKKLKLNLQAWKYYYNGIVEAADLVDRGKEPSYFTDNVP